VRHRAGVFGKLHLAQHAHIINALHRAPLGVPTISAENPGRGTTVSPSFSDS